PGFGEPSPPGWDPTPEAYVDWLIAEAESFGYPPGYPIDLVGHDWGTGHVFGALAKRPDLFRSVVTDCAGFLHPDYEWHDLAQSWQKPDEGEEVVAAMAALSTEDRVALFVDLGLTEDVAADMAGAFTEDTGRCILGLYRGAVPPYLRELGDRVAELDGVPTFFVSASDDPYIPARLSEDVAIRLNADLLTLEGQGHWWLAHAHEQVADHLVEFWNSLEED
ncbi:MAG: alpha/beta hydrolase, partial [Acidimicrobiia bacterium]|nr:alpha/beta hydrolase [Acidimicrobiia bacterium]